MPAKREQIALQTEVTNQEQWDDLMAIEGLAVVDVYQKWCGPCAAVVSLFRRIRNELGDDLLKLAVAEADNIDSLEPYRGFCEPCFLFFGGGQLVHVVRGANGPALFRGVQAELAAEHKVLEEGAERKVIVDPLLAQVEAQERAKSQAELAEKQKAEEEAMKQEFQDLGLDLGVRPVSHGTIDTITRGYHGSEPVPKEVTIVLIKPDAVQNGEVDNIMQKLAENGFEVLAQEEKTLTEEEAREFYSDQQEEEHFESLVTFMSSGPSKVLVLTKGDTGEGVIHEVRNLLGPKDVSVAKEEAPESLRAMFGTDTTMNALHGADSKERAARELSFFFPTFVVPHVPGTGPPPQVEKTLALIRPEALKEHKDAIMEKIHEAGFEVCLQKEVQLTEEQAKSFYSHQEGQPHYEALITEMTKGPVLALGLAKEEAIQGWRNLLGPAEIEKAKDEAPDSLRAQFSIPDVSINALHGSDSIQSATKELEFFFPKEHTLAVIKPDAADEHKDAIVERIREAGFNIMLEKHVELTRDLASKLYQEHEGKEFYEGLLDHMTSGKSTVMILSREDAVHGLRTLMGPTDPEKAREEAPESFRALLGKDILANAIHGSSNAEQAVEKIPQLFPEVTVTEDGSIIVPEPSAPGEGQEGDQEGAEEGATEDTGETTEAPAAPGSMEEGLGNQMEDRQGNESNDVENEEVGMLSSGNAGDPQSEIEQEKGDDSDDSNHNDAERDSFEETSDANERSEADGANLMTEAAEGEAQQTSEEGVEQPATTDGDAPAPAEGDPGETAPAEAAPAEGNQDGTAPAEGTTEAPPEGVAPEEAGGGETVPAAADETAPAEGEDATPAPAEGEETVPAAEGADTTPAEGETANTEQDGPKPEDAPSAEESNEPPSGEKPADEPAAEESPPAE